MITENPSDKGTKTSKPYQMEDVLWLAMQVHLKPCIARPTFTKVARSSFGAHARATCRPWCCRLCADGLLRDGIKQSLSRGESCRPILQGVIAVATAGLLTRITRSWVILSTAPPEPKNAFEKMCVISDKVHSYSYRRGLTLLACNTKWMIAHMQTPKPLVPPKTISDPLLGFVLQNSVLRCEVLQK